VQKHLERIQADSTLHLTLVVAVFQAIAALGIIYFVNRRKPNGADRYELNLPC
jgi:hypothetical protein